VSHLRLVVEPGVIPLVQVLIINQSLPRVPPIYEGFWVKLSDLETRVANLFCIGKPSKTLRRVPASSQRWRYWGSFRYAWVAPGWLCVMNQGSLSGEASLIGQVRHLNISILIHLQVPVYHSTKDGLLVNKIFRGGIHPDPNWRGPLKHVFERQHL